jgi:hypothetical protein
LVVDLVPSLCWVVELVLDCPPGFCVVVVLVCFDGSLDCVELLFWPSGFSVVVVVDIDWAMAVPPKARLNPSTAAASCDLESMLFLLYVVIVRLQCTTFYSHPAPKSGAFSGLGSSVPGALSPMRSSAVQ